MNVFNCGIIRFLIVAAAIMVLEPWEALAGKMYWTDRREQRIQRANLDGSGRETILSGLPDPIGIALDVVAGKMYWTDEEAGAIQRANLNGSDVETLLTGLPMPQFIALDVPASRMYWVDLGTIQRANLDGSGRETLLSGLPSPRGIALDLAAGKMYWGDRDSDSIQRANLDGSGVEILVTGLPYPQRIALDLTAGKMYWVDVGSDSIQRANLDGSGVETLVTGLPQPHSITLDVAAGKMYWPDATADWIRRANLDGSGVETLLTGLRTPVDIALDLTVTYDTWSSRSVDFPPHEPIHDCVRLTENTISTDLCDSGPLFKFPLLAIPDVDLWIGQVPCGGQNLFFVGTTLDSNSLPLGGRAIGASIIGLNTGTTLGLEGFEDADCSTSAEANVYASSTASSVQRELSSFWSEGGPPILEIGPAGAAQSVANKTYEIWFSQAFDLPPFFPGQDCWRFTATTVTTDQCGDVGPLIEFPLFGGSGFSLWIGRVPCGGQNLVFFGTSFDGAIFPFGGNVVSATAVGLTQGFTLAGEGFENPSCSIFP